MRPRPRRKLFPRSSERPSLPGAWPTGPLTPVGGPAREGARRRSGGGASAEARRIHVVSPVGVELSVGTRALADELGELVRIAAHRPDITVSVGAPGCGWSFRPDLGRVQVDPLHLEGQSADFCRGLALHEAAHARLTRYHEMIPPDLQRAPGLARLLNVIEDCRIETWLGRRVPGSRPWIRSYNDILFGNLRRADSRAGAAAQFLMGILAHWWYGEAPTGMLPEAAEALAATLPAIAAAVEAQPPGVPLAEGQVRALYAAHPVARAYLPQDLRIQPSADACIARMAQYRAWEIIHARVVPAFRALTDADAAAKREQRSAFEALLDQLAAGHIEDPDGRLRGALEGIAEAPDAGAASSGTQATREAVQAAFELDPTDRYLTVWQRLHPSIDALSRDLLEIFERRNRSRITRGHASGTRIHLPAAMQFEARPDTYRTLWERRTTPQRIDPCFVLLVDTSASMRGARIAATFDGIVLLCEVAARVGMPLEVFQFNEGCTRVHAWDDGVDEGLRRRLGGLPDAVTGGTCLGEALGTVRRRVAELPFRDLFVLVLSDGETTDPEVATRHLDALRRGGATCMGLGLGPEARALRDVFPDAPVGISVEEVPGRLVAALRSSVGA